MAGAGDVEASVRALYDRVLDGWNRASGEAFAAPFAEDGDVVMGPEKVMDTVELGQFATPRAT